MLSIAVLPVGTPPADAVVKAMESVPKAIPGNYFETIRKYIPVEVMALWATVKQLLDILFDGAVNTPFEVNTFAVVWTGELPYSSSLLCAVRKHSDLLVSSAA
jgi:hypothetical protein